MRHVEQFPHPIREIQHTVIEMPDGCKLGARIWMPENANQEPVPAILEYLPYRKSDGTVFRDGPMQSYLAGHGYAVIRLDLRGTGDSEGLMLDEYLPQELQDGYAAIDWISNQPWCDGQVGMVGISWGGFNGLQIAAMQPPALKSIVTLCSTDDRYADDVHYMGGCMLSEQLSWASVMFSHNTLPPDPQNVGDQWRDLWMQRKNESGLWLKNWLEHQTRDEFWKHGSVCEDWSDIQIPVYAVSGWADGYCRSVFRLMDNLQGPKKGLIGPWAHTYPHIGSPGPAIGFLQEELRWWDYWLKGIDTGVMDEPQLRLFMQDSVTPKGTYDLRPGRWVAEPSWPSPNINRTPFYLHTQGSLSTSPASSPGSLLHTSPASVGMASGKWCSYAKPGDTPLDQRAEDAGSLCFDFDVTDSPFEMAGDANVHLRISVNQPVAQLAARLCDVAPDGRSTRVSYGVLNLTHRDCHEFPQHLIPGEIYDVVIPMKHVAQSFAVGQKVRLAISTNYFPMIWPTPAQVELTLHTDGSHLELPLRTISELDQQLADSGPVISGPATGHDIIKQGENYFRIIGNAADNKTEMQIADGAGTYRLHDNDLTKSQQAYETYRIDNEDPAMAEGWTLWDCSMSRGDWAIRTRTETHLRSDAEHFILQARLQAWEGEELVTELEWNERIPRNFN